VKTIRTYLKTIWLLTTSKKRTSTKMETMTSLTTHLGRNLIIRKNTRKQQLKGLSLPTTPEDNPLKVGFTRLTSLIEKSQKRKE